jgi:hypothetical protein
MTTPAFPRAAGCKSRRVGFGRTSARPKVRVHNIATARTYSTGRSAWLATNQMVDLIEESFNAFLLHAEHILSVRERNRDKSGARLGNCIGKTSVVVG